MLQHVDVMGSHENKLRWILPLFHSFWMLAFEVVLQSHLAGGRVWQSCGKELSLFSIVVIAIALGQRGSRQPEKHLALEPGLGLRQTCETGMAS